MPIVLLLPLLASRRPRLPPAVAPEPGLPPALPQGSSGDVVAVDAAVVAQLWLRAAGLIVPCWCCERTSRTCPAVQQPVQQPQSRSVAAAAAAVSPAMETENSETGDEVD